MPTDGHKVNRLTYVPGRVLAAARHAARLTQESVAEQIECSRQALINWESGAKRPLTTFLRAYLRCLEAHGVTIERRAASWTIEVHDREADE